MSIAEMILPEFDEEIEATRRMLERVPGDRLGWRPHEKSMTLGRLASHIAEVPGWTQAVLGQDEFDMQPPGGSEFEAADLGSVEEILTLLGANATSARQAIAATDDGEFGRSWTLKKGGEEVFTAPKGGVLRSSVLNHLIHHRGQLTVYLRLTGASVPQTYGPTADEPTV